MIVSRIENAITFSFFLPRELSHFQDVVEDVNRSLQCNPFYKIHFMAQLQHTMTDFSCWPLVAARENIQISILYSPVFGIFHSDHPQKGEPTNIKTTPSWV